MVKQDGINMTKDRLMLTACSLSALLVLLLLSIFGQDNNSYLASKSIRPLAIYRHMVIGGYDSTFDELLIRDPVGEAVLYLELPNKRQFLLSDLPENDAGQILEKHDNNLNSVRPENSIDYSIGHTFLTYRNGKLHFAALTDSCPFRISPNKDGPYVKLPISRETLLEVFGEPIRWEKAPRPPSGP
jgi:hypothetical protein